MELCKASQLTWLWAIGYVQREEQGISGRKGNPHRGIGAQRNTPRLREAPFLLLVCMGEKFKMGPEMQTEAGHVINGFIHYVEGLITSGDTMETLRMF